MAFSIFEKEKEDQEEHQKKLLRRISWWVISMKI